MHESYRKPSCIEHFTEPKARVMHMRLQAMERAYVLDSFMKFRLTVRTSMCGPRNSASNLEYVGTRICFSV